MTTPSSSPPAALPTPRTVVAGAVLLWVGYLLVLLIGVGLLSAVSGFFNLMDRWFYPDSRAAREARAKKAGEESP